MTITKLLSFIVVAFVHNISCTQQFIINDCDTNYSSNYYDALSKENFSDKYDSFHFMCAFDDISVREISITTNINKNAKDNYNSYLYNDKFNTITDKVNARGADGLITAFVRKKCIDNINVCIDDDIKFDITIDNSVPYNSSVSLNNIISLNQNVSYMVNLYGRDYDTPYSNDNIIWIKKNDNKAITEGDIEKRCYPCCNAYKDCTKLISSITTPTGSCDNSKMSTIKNSSTESGSSRSSKQEIKQQIKLQKQELKKQQQELKRLQKLLKQQQRIKK